MKGAARHRFIYRFAKAILTPVLKHLLHYSFKQTVSASTPSIVLCNHVTPLDPLLAGLAFREPMYFVASDHLFRMGFLSRLLIFAVAPIARAKTTTDTHAVLEIYRRLKAGHSVCIFAEGNMTFSGVTGDIPDSIGKLAKRTGVRLITFRFRGGYFTYPRWSKTIRRGSMAGEEVRQYAPEELKAMTDEEVCRAIRRDLYVDAYEDQKNSPVAYLGKTPAEQLENALYCCPRCHSFASLASCRDLLACACGYQVRYSPYGYFETFGAKAHPVVYKTITEWYAWQEDALRQKLREIAGEDSETPIFSDRDQQFYHTVRARKNVSLGVGTLSIYRDRLVFSPKKGPSLSFPIQNIADMSVITRMTLIFSTADRQSYEVHSAKPRSALKYLHAYRDLKSGVT